MICLERGRKVFETQDIAGGVQRYMSMSAQDTRDSVWHNADNSFDSEYFKPLRFGLYNAKGEVNSAAVRRGDELYVEIEGIARKPEHALCVGYSIYDQAGTRLYWTFQSDQIGSNDELPVLDGHVCLRSRVPLDILNLGTKRLELAVQTYRDNWIVAPGREAPTVSFTLEGPASNSPYYVLQRDGTMAINAGWTIKEA